MTSKLLSPLTSYLLSPTAVRERCSQLFDLAKKGQLLHFNYHPARLAATSAYVAEEIRQNYPDLVIPYHSRWQHFNVGGIDRLKRLKELPQSPLEKGRQAFDLVITSVLLDAGSGPKWSYMESESNTRFSRSEGLAVASFHTFINGHFSNNQELPYRADGEALANFSEATLEKSFQVSPQNPLAGVSGRCALIQDLGKAVLEQTVFFGKEAPRLGNLFDYCINHAKDNTLKAEWILKTVLSALGQIWPGRITFEEVNLGDCWEHPLVTANDSSNTLIPFHKLSQWLTYSLFEPLEEYGITITEMHALTGLAEYRNGGLLLDSELITLKDPSEAKISHKPDSPLIIEWRALTVVLLDIIASEVRQILNMSEADFSLPKVLQGGTWSAGRKIAAEKRASGTPPITLDSDGTVF